MFERIEMFSVTLYIKNSGFSILVKYQPILLKSMADRSYFLLMPVMMIASTGTF